MAKVRSLPFTSPLKWPHHLLPPRQRLGQRIDPLRSETITLAQACGETPIAPVAAGLTLGAMSDKMLDMKQVNAREFQKSFSSVTDALPQGQTIAITKRGKPLGFFTKAPAAASVPMPDFAANLASMPYSPDDAERIVREVLDEAG